MNTPAFLLAVLLYEKLVRSMQGKLRRHELMDPSVFTDKVEKLMSSGTEVKSKASGKSVRKAPAKKPAPLSMREKATPDNAEVPAFTSPSTTYHKLEKICSSPHSL